MSDIHAELRALMILRALQRSALHPTPIEVVHTIAYLADVMATVWKIPAMQDSLLKTADAPRSVRLHRALDRLIGRGMVAISQVSYEYRGGRAQLWADYTLLEERCTRVFKVLDVDPDWRAESHAIAEISLCVSALGRDQIQHAVLLDASYSDPRLDASSLLDLDPDIEGRRTPTQRANEELDDIARSAVGRGLGAAELTNLYVGHLYSILETRPRS